MVQVGRCDPRPCTCLHRDHASPHTQCSHFHPQPQKPLVKILIDELGDQLYRPTPGPHQQWESPEALRHRFLIRTKARGQAGARGEGGRGKAEGEGERGKARGQAGAMGEGGGEGERGGEGAGGGKGDGGGEGEGGSEGEGGGGSGERPVWQGMRGE